MRYGPDPSQFVDVQAPVAPRAVCVVLHGGFWRAAYGADLMTALCDDLVERGYATWNAEYRRVGAGGGWTSTFDDVEQVVRSAHDPGLPVVTIGHSAGGQLALWAAARCGAALAVAMAGVVDLDEAWRLGLSSHAVAELLGGSPEDVPSRYTAASPLRLLPLRTRQLIVHGSRDEVVPVEMSHAYARRAESVGDAVDLVVTDEGHFECLDPSSESWRAVVARLP